MGRFFYARTGVEVKDTLTPGLLAARGAIRPRVINAVLVVGDEIRNRAHDLANVSPGVKGHAADGGHMRDKIEVVLIEEPNSVSVKIGIDPNNVPYAVHQEFGPRGKPFMRPAVDEVRPQAHLIMKEALQGTRAATFVRFRKEA